MPTDRTSWRWVRVRPAGSLRGCCGRAIERPDGSLWAFHRLEGVEAVRGDVGQLAPEQVAILLFPRILGLLDRIHEEMEKPVPASSRRVRQWIRNLAGVAGKWGEGAKDRARIREQRKRLSKAARDRGSLATWD